MCVSCNLKVRGGETVSDHFFVVNKNVISSALWFTVLLQFVSQSSELFCGYASNWTPAPPYFDTSATDIGIQRGNGVVAREPIREKNRIQLNQSFRWRAILMFNQLPLFLCNTTTASDVPCQPGFNNSLDH